jgi:L-ascorbate oxidase
MQQLAQSKHVSAPAVCADQTQLLSVSDNLWNVEEEQSTGIGRTTAFWTFSCFRLLFGLLFLGAGAAVMGLTSTTKTPSLTASTMRPSLSNVTVTWTVTSGTFAGHIVLLLNGQWRGPVINLTHGDNVTFQLTNNQDEPISVHWHAIHQRGTPNADGASGASTTPVSRGETRIWQFVADPVGTHFYHAHAGLAAVQGLHGVVIVNPRRPSSGEEYSAIAALFDAEAPPFLFTDWWDAPLSDLARGLNGAGDSFQWVGNPNALFVNAVNATAGVTATIPTFAMPVGRTIRLRLVNGAALTFLNLGFQGHNVTVVESDGSPVEPFSTAAIDINAGERYSVLLTPSAEALASGVVWMSMATRHRAGGPSGLVALTLPGATVGGPWTPPAVPLPCQPAWNDTAATLAFARQLSSLSTASPPPLAVGNTQPTVLLGTQNRVAGGLLKWSVNNVSFIYPHSQPTLGMVESEDSSHGAAAEQPMLDIASAAASGNTAALAKQSTWVSGTAKWTGDGYARSVAATVGTNALMFSPGQVVDVLLQNAPSLNGVSEQHPWHMHGGAFWVMAWGLGSWNSSQDALARGLMQARPPVKDTVTVVPGGWTWLRLVTDNPGVWPLHCHILWHQTMGMQTVLVVEPAP